MPRAQKDPVTPRPKPITDNSSDSGSSEIPVVLFSECRANYHQFVLAIRAERKRQALLKAKGERARSGRHVSRRKSNRGYQKPRLDPSPTRNPKGAHDDTTDQEEGEEESPDPPACPTLIRCKVDGLTKSDRRSKSIDSSKSSKSSKSPTAFAPLKPPIPIKAAVLSKPPKRTVEAEIHTYSTSLCTEDSSSNYSRLESRSNEAGPSTSSRANPAGPTNFTSPSNGAGSSYPAERSNTAVPKKFESTSNGAGSSQSAGRSNVAVPIHAASRLTTEDPSYSASRSNPAVSSSSAKRSNGPGPSYSASSSKPAATTHSTSRLSSADPSYSASRSNPAALSSTAKRSNGAGTSYSASSSKPAVPTHSANRLNSSNPPYSVSRPSPAVSSSTAKRSNGAGTSYSASSSKPTDFAYTTGCLNSTNPPYSASRPHLAVPSSTAKRSNGAGTSYPAGGSKAASHSNRAAHSGSRSKPVGLSHPAGRSNLADSTNSASYSNEAGPSYAAGTSNLAGPSTSTSQPCPASPSNSTDRSKSAGLTCCTARTNASSSSKTDVPTKPPSVHRNSDVSRCNLKTKTKHNKEVTNNNKAYEERLLLKPEHRKTVYSRSKLPSDKNNENYQSDEKDNGETSDWAEQSPIKLQKNCSIESEDDPPPGVVTQQPTSRLHLHRQSTTSDPTYPTDTKSFDPVTSTDSGKRTADVYNSGSSESNLRGSFPTFLPRSDSYPNLSSNYHQEIIYERQPCYYHEGITNVIDARLQHDIVNSTPVSTWYSRRQYRGFYQTDDQPRSWPVYQQSFPADYDVPSPAPSTPIKHRRQSFHGVSKHLQSRNLRQQCPWTYEDFERLAYESKHNSYKRQRHVAFKGLDDSDEETAPYHYSLQDQAAALPSAYDYNHRSSYYGADPHTEQFQPNHGPPAHTYSAYRYIPATSVVKNIHESLPSRSNIDDIEWPMGRMNPLEDHERKIIIEFCHLLEKSKQLFNGLRELPQYGHKQWSLYFGRTFDIYTRLWKYQQQHRGVLDSKYGMKRWQIGEIASKIGQLYYHFYLRTSETAYLNEAFSFYYAIRGRCYYTKANKEDKCELMVKKLRYYARFIVVCLLLNKMKLVKELIKELERQIIEYGNTYDPDDQVEWTVVVDEVKAFVHAEPVVSIVNTDNQTMLMSHRLTPIITPPVERTPQMNLSLQEILIVGSSSQQVKFSELTMDMFRMLQTLEREPSGDVQHIFDESPRQRFMSTPNAPSQEGPEGQKHPNPHKYLLFKPSPSQMLVYLASGCNDLPPNGALLLYISADGHVPQPPKHAEDGYELGGLITTSKNDIYRECNKDPKSSSSAKYKELQCLYPGDLYPFTRRPLFVVVDSDNSYAFQNIPRHFGQPLIILMSPLDMPPSYHDPRRQGSLFTLFLHAPLEGLCYSCDLSSITLALWERAQLLIDTFMAEAANIIVRSRLVDPTYISYMGDDFFRLLITRYVFCEATLRLHRLFRGRTHRTRCSPPMPDDLFEHPTLVHIIVDLANALQIRNHIQDPAVGNRDREGASGGN